MELSKNNNKFQLKTNNKITEKSKIYTNNTSRITNKLENTKTISKLNSTLNESFIYKKENTTKTELSNEIIKEKENITEKKSLPIKKV